ncbi:hypothetical protein [Streptomyces phaeochromogenes]
MDQGPNSSPGLIRFFITLPEPVDIPDGYVWQENYDHDPEGGGIQQFVHMIFMQSSGSSRQQGSLAAAMESINRVNEHPPNLEINDGNSLTGQYTTVIASTLNDRNIQPESQWVSPQDIPIEHDPLNRCIEEIANFLRAYRAAVESLCVVPTYERIGPIIPFQAGEFTPLEDADEDQAGFRIPKWGDPGALMLENSNFSDIPPSGEITSEDEGRIDYFRSLLGKGNSLFLWKERFVEARKALYREGNYGASVTLSNTASEVLLDALLSLMYWESGKNPGDVADVFAEGRLARRVKANFAELLGGNWSLDGTGHVADWFHNCYLLRHRVVHGGYSPSRLEAQTALDVTFSLSLYCWDRLAEKRKKFPRTALITIAEEGLRKRGKWCRFIQDFSRDVAPVEPSWRNDSQAWRQDMYNALLAGN